MADITALRDLVAGRVIDANDASYDEARSIWNGMIDKRPAMIVRCHGTADVVEAIRFARDNQLEIAVRGGGHNVAGNALTDGGLVIDLSEMRGVSVDPMRRRARAQGGVTLADYDRETQLFGLASTMGQISMTGIAGLTLGGGLGWLMRKHGLACDNLVGAQLVSASGEILQVTAESHPSLLWALRGGGGNFGVVTNFEYELHPIGPIVYGGLVNFPAERTLEILGNVGSFLESADAELGVSCYLLTAPPLPFIPPEMHFRPVISVAVCWAGDLAHGEKVVGPIRSWRPIVDVFGPMPYVQLQGMFDAGYGAGRRCFFKSGYLDELSEGAAKSLTEGLESIPSPFSVIECIPMGGAMAAVGPEHSAFGNRSSKFLFNIASMWEDATADNDQIDWSRRLFADLSQYSNGGVYVNYLTNEEGTSRVKAAYGEDVFEKLVAVKSEYDPENIFHLNQNISVNRNARNGN